MHNKYEEVEAELADQRLTNKELREQIAKLTKERDSKDEEINRLREQDKSSSHIITTL